MASKLFAASVIAFVGSLAMPALAAVPDASGRYQLTPSRDSTPSIAFSGLPFSVHDEFTTINVLGQSQPSISIASVRGSPDRQSSGSASLTYFFRFQAADADAYSALLEANALVNFAGLSTITDTRTGSEGFFSSGRTGLIVRADETALTDITYECGNFRSEIGGCGTQAFSFGHAAGNFAEDSTLSLFGSVTLFAFSENGGDGVQVDRSNAFIDPIITLQARGLDLSRYTLQLSNGIGNGATLSGIPEPASWALMLAGFGLAGGALRRRGKADLAHA